MYDIIVKNSSVETILDINEIESAKVTRQKNKSDSAEIEVSKNLDTSLFVPMQTLVTVKDDEEIIFRGRIIDVQKDIYNNLSISCEGALSYLNDTQYAPFDFSGTPDELLSDVLDNHNANVENDKKIYLGTVTVEDSNDYIARSSESYLCSLEVINTRLVDGLDGYLVVRYEGDLIYLDWLAELTHVNDQAIELGSNLMDVEIEYDYQDVITRLIPLGTEDEDTGEILDISSVNNGVLYIDDEDAIEKYGIITGINTWDDVTVASNLLTKAKQFLANNSKAKCTISIKAIDLNMIDSSIEKFHLGDWILVNIPTHDIYDTYELSEIEYDILEPQNSTITLGDVEETSTSYTRSSVSELTSSLSQYFNSISAIKADFTSLSAVVATINEAYITEAQIETLIAGYGYFTEAEVEKLIASYGYIDELTVTNMLANYVETSTLTANYITTNELSATYATISDLTTQIASINTLLANYATIETLEADYATITSLNAVSETVGTLDADVANITSLLAGNAGVGDLQVINLSSANVVIADATITDAMIADLSVSKLLAGTIYTSLITIQTAEDDASLYISGSTLQINDGNYVRVQIGEDGNGDYNLYLWDASGNLLWDALGLTEAGVSGNGGIIKDIAVADDAAIKGTKLDIESVAQCLTEDGTLTVDASNIIINESTLAAEYKTITQNITDIQSDSMKTITTYYALGASDTEPPSDPTTTDTTIASYVGTAIVGSSMIGIVGWTTDRLVASEENYLWVAYYVEYIDGTTSWTTPTCITDGYLKDSVTTLTTSFEVVNGQISSKVWMSDIEEATGTLQDQYSELVQTQDSITATVADLVTTTDTHESRISSLEITADGITTTVSEAITNALDGYATQTWAESQISQSAEDITSTVNKTLEDYATVSTVSSMIEQTADEITLTVNEVKENALKSDTVYFALGSSCTTPPSDPSTTDTTVAATVGTAVVGSSKVGTIGWSTTQPSAAEGSYVWMAELLTKLDGTTSWTTPVCLTDDYVRSTVTDMGAELTIAVDSISSKVWMDDIEEVNSEVTVLLSRYSEVVQNAEELILRVATVESTVSENTTYIGELQVTSDSIVATVSGLSDYINTTVLSIVYYYAASANSEYAPEEGEQLSGIVGTAVVGEAQVDNDTTVAVEWSEDITGLTDVNCYIWCYTETTYSNGIIEDSDPYLVGTYDSTVSSVYTQYYLSSSDEELADGEWVTECPGQVSGTYLWTRIATEYTDGTVAYTTAECNTVWNSTTTIVQTMNSIVSDALEEYVTVTDFGSTVTALESSIEQTAENITFTFESRTETLEETAEGLQEQLNEYATYFIFSSEGLKIAEKNSEFSLLLANDRISFLDDGGEVAYITNSILYITDAYLTNSLQIGSFQWIPRESGNLSLVKVS